MGITIKETGNSGGRRPKEAQFVIATAPPVPRGGLRPNGTNGKGKGNGKRNGNGKKPKRAAKPRGSRRVNLEVLNAFGKLSLGLPRAVGDYTYVTTIDNISIPGTGTEQMHVFCPFTHKLTGDGNVGNCFTSIVSYSTQYGGVSGLTSAGIRVHNSLAVADAMQGGTELVPASMSVRITCPTSLQAASGQYFLGKWNINADPRGYVTYQHMVDGFMSYGQPRPLTAARLAMRGVQCNAMPRNMADASEFLHVAADIGDGSQDIVPFNYATPTGPWDGFTPIILVVQDSTASTTVLNVQVAIKWRYRFPMTNPAAKTHSFQGISSDTIWNDVCRDASEAMHGVEAIKDGAEALL